MRVLKELEPQKVFYFFEEICKIPHGSGNIGMISDYLRTFAEKRELEVIQDEAKNIIIIKEATVGYEEEPPVMIQGHMDMVAVHKPELNIDMTKDALRLRVEGDRVYAEGTSLGGDDGIAVAYALAILDDNTLKHPRLEVVITVDEETGMDGARVIDISMLRSKRLLNIDSEEEGIFLTGCAGGARVDCVLTPAFSQKSGLLYELTLSGLAGGHSGVEIHKERGNSNILAGRLLWNLFFKEVSIGLIGIKGGLADNAIPRETVVNVVVEPEHKERFECIVREFEEMVRRELMTKDPGFFVNLRADGCGEVAAVCDNEFCILASFLHSLPNGVQAMSADVAGLVETSLNLGVLRLQEQELHASFSVRSSLESSKQAVIEKLMAIVVLAGGQAQTSGDYPGWAYRVHSPLRDKMLALYEEMYDAKPQVEAIHAGLECGLLTAKREDLDCVSFGPNIYNIHTTEEYLSITSTKRVWEYLVALLAKKD